MSVALWFKFKNILIAVIVYFPRALCIQALSWISNKGDAWILINITVGQSYWKWFWNLFSTGPFLHSPSCPETISHKTFGILQRASTFATHERTHTHNKSNTESFDSISCGVDGNDDPLKRDNNLHFHSLPAHFKCFRSSIKWVWRSTEEGKEGRRRDSLKVLDAV